MTELSQAEKKRLTEALLVLCYRYEGVPIKPVMLTRRMNDDGVRGMTEEEFRAWARALIAEREN